jgi:hypothetical protein
MEYVVKFPPRPHIQALMCGAFLGAVLPLVPLDETLLPANMRAPLKAKIGGVDRPRTPPKPIFGFRKCSNLGVTRG